MGVSGADDLGVEDDLFSFAFEVDDLCFAVFFLIGRFKGLLLKCLNHLVEAFELAVGPARDVHPATDLLQNCGADAEVFGDLGDGLVEVLLQRGIVDVALQLSALVAHVRLGLCDSGDAGARRLLGDFCGRAWSFGDDVVVAVVEHHERVHLGHVCHSLFVAFRLHTRSCVVR